jgi:hypothetical protein
VTGPMTAIVRWVSTLTRWKVQSISHGKTRGRIQDLGKQVVLWVSVGVPSLARLRASKKASQLIRLRVSHLFFSWGACESDEFGGFDFCWHSSPVVVWVSLWAGVGGDWQPV